METDLGLRLGMRYPVVDLGRLAGTHPYHLEHARRLFDRTTRRKNPRQAPVAFDPNGPGWGLATEEIPLRAGIVRDSSPHGPLPGEVSHLRISTAVAVRTLQELVLAASRRLVRVVGREPAEVAVGISR
jgi:hypothetical protein